MTDQIPLLSRPDQITAEWLTAVLRASGDLPTGVVSDFDAKQVGTGQVGDSFRFTLRYDGGEGPSSVVGKFASADETSRAASVTTRTYEIESRFYQQLRDRVHIRTPRPYVALYDHDAYEFVLVLEDMAPAEQGDQLTGCGLDEASLAMIEAARLHAPVWGAPDLVDLSWLNRNTPDSLDFTVGLFDTLYPGFVERYGDRVDADVAEEGARLIARLSDYITYRPEPHTAVHGDFRLDNMLFGTTPDGPPLTVVDWQTLALGPAASDISYFLGTSLTPDLRAVHERGLLAEYHSVLVAEGVTGYDLERCWYDYRRFAFAGFLMAVGASMLVGQTERGDEMFMAMANRSGRMAIELESYSLLDD